VRANCTSIAPFVRARFVVLGTDGFGRSDTRAALRAYFEVDRAHVAVAALSALADDRAIAAQTVADALARYGIRTDTGDPWGG
jgi:pyruvate dehydrogenase E1 component